MFEIRPISASALTHAIACPCLVSLGLAAGLMPASAYRPFDGTDAAVADKDTLEIELQPAGLFKDESGTTILRAPVTRFNYGFVERWEAVLEGQLETPLSPSGPSSITNAGAFLKNVLREGALQDKSGPSVATEFGVLLPDSRGHSQFGASLAGVVSQRWDWGTIHLNGAAALSREHRADLFASAIIEGPSKWTVRPVAEVFYEKEFGKAETISALVGLIWKVHDKLSFDVGLRHALMNGHPLSELRAGMTVDIPLSRSLSSRY
jgi:hypothetical protein